MNEEQTSEILFGVRPVMEAIHAGREIDRIYIENGNKEGLLIELIQLATRLNLPFQKVPKEKLNRITRKNHQGVIAFPAQIQFSSLDHIIDACFAKGRDPLILLLDRITDVRNFGAIARTAECFGVDALVVPATGNAPISSDSMKTSAGALNHIPVCRVPNLLSTLDYLQQSGLRLVAASEKGNTAIDQLKLDGPVAVIMGSEEDGVSSQILRKCEDIAFIPQMGKVNSLNVSVATGMFLYEALRQRNFK